MHRVKDSSKPPYFLLLLLLKHANCKLNHKVKMSQKAVVILLITYCVYYKEHVKEEKETLYPFWLLSGIF